MVSIGFFVQVEFGLMIKYRNCWNGTEEDEMVEDFITGANASVGLLYKGSRIVWHSTAGV